MSGGRERLARLERTWYPDPGAVARPSLLLRLAARPYRFAVAVRTALYDRGILAPRRAGVPCIGVGNLTVGGTGKTPLVAWLAEELQARGRRPAVVSRGYGGSAKGPGRVPPGGGWREAERWGDEPALLAALLPDVPVVVGRDRHAAARLAVEECGAGIVVADDAFQHRRLARDLDIVVVDASRGMGNGLLLPAGPLREPPAALRRADLVVLNRMGAASDAAALRREMARLAPGAGLVETDLALVGWRDVRTGRSAELPRGRVAAFCGIANPASFRRSLEGSGLELAAFEIFRDHHAYRGADLEALARQTSSSGAVAAVTTAKDAVRIAAWPGELPLYRAEVKLVIMHGLERLWDRLNALAARGRV